MGKKRPPPKGSAENARFKDLLGKLVRVPKKELDEKIAALRKARQEGEPEPET